MGERITASELRDALTRLEIAIQELGETLGVAIRMSVDPEPERSAGSTVKPFDIGSDKTIESINLKPREVATLGFVKSTDSNEISSSQWEDILDHWRDGGFSYAKTQASVSLVLSRLVDVGALREIDRSGFGGSRTFRLTGIGEALFNKGNKRLLSQKKNPNSHQPWSPEMDRTLLENVRKNRNSYGQIANSMISRWAKKEGRSNNAIRSRINKYDEFPNSYHPFEENEFETIQQAQAIYTRKREMLRFLSDELGRAPQIIEVMIDDMGAELTSTDERERTRN